MLYGHRPHDSALRSALGTLVNEIRAGQLDGYGTILKRDLKRIPAVLDIASQVASAADASYSDTPVARRSL